jgi:DNA-binding CsgD family transcriptional regulator
MDRNENLEDAPVRACEQGLTRGQLIAGFVGEAQVVDLSVIWRGLTNGTLKVNDHFTQGDWSYLVLREVHHRSTESLPVNSVAVIESVVRSGASKIAALELRCNETAVVAHTRRVLSMMGLHCPVSRAPMLLLQAAYASEGLEVLARVARFDTRDTRLLVLGAPRLAPAAAAVLSQGERDVVCGLLDGKTYAEIAHARGRAVRTVANQLATVFRKLGASSRLHLVRLLLPSLNSVEV